MPPSRSTPSLVPLLHGRQGPLRRRASPSRRSTITAERAEAAPRWSSAPGAHDRAADLHRRPPCRRLRRPLCARPQRASSIRFSAAPDREPDSMTATAPLRRRLRPDALRARPAARTATQAVAPRPRGGAAGRALRADAGDDLARRARPRRAVRQDRRRGARPDARGLARRWRARRRVDVHVGSLAPCGPATRSPTAPS